MERLEEKHEKKAKAMARRGSNDTDTDTCSVSGNAGTGIGDHSKTPWARSGVATPVDAGLSTLGLTDDPMAYSRPPTHSQALSKSDFSQPAQPQQQLRAHLQAGAPASPVSASSRSDTTSGSSTQTDLSPMSQSTMTNSTAATSIEGESESGDEADQLDPSKSKSTAMNINTSIETLLAYPTPLCTLPTRVRMTNLYNSLLKEFCERYSDYFAFIDISPHMHGRGAGVGNDEREGGDDEKSKGEKHRTDKQGNSSNGTAASGREKEGQSPVSGPELFGSSPTNPSTSTKPRPTYTSLHGEVDRSTWACPVDPTNIHPVWEATLPLWLTELRRAGVPVDRFELDEDAEETFRAYEADKRKRTEGREFAWSGSASGAGKNEGEGEGEGEGAWRERKIREE